MIIEKLTEEEKQFLYEWHTPICMLECLFSNFDNLVEFDKKRFGKVRKYQHLFPSHESIIDFEGMEADEKKRFQLRKNVADVYNYGARKFGKTLITEKLDIPLSMLHDDGYWCGFSSADSIHLRSVLDPVKEATDNHPILKLWRKNSRTAPNYRLDAHNGWYLDGINMNLASKNPGHQFFGKHVKKLWIEEASFETDNVYKKRKEALSELGAVIRSSGMTNFTKHQPAGKCFYDLANRKSIINLPQYINPFWDDKEKQDRLKEYGGEDSIGYRVFVKGEVVEEGVSEFDMERVRKCYQEKETIKKFEITKERYPRFQNLIVVERPKNADRIFICADIGESAGTDIIILSEVGNKYNYLYNITLYNLTHFEQVKVFQWLLQQIETNVIGIDCGDGTGRAIYRSLEKTVPIENLVWYAGSNKIAVDFEKNDKGNAILVKGEPVYKEEIMKEWSVRRLKALLYETRMSLPIDYKFDTQINSVIALQSGTRTIYQCVAESNHLFEAFRVFAISQWLKGDFNQTKPIRKEWGIGVSSWTKK